MNFNRVFHYKPGILGYPYFWKHPYHQNLSSPFFQLSHQGCMGEEDDKIDKPPIRQCRKKLWGKSFEVFVSAGVPKKSTNGYLETWRIIPGIYKLWMAYEWPFGGGSTTPSWGTWCTNQWLGNCWIFIWTNQNDPISGGWSPLNHGGEGWRESPSKMPQNSGLGIVGKICRVIYILLMEESLHQLIW